MKKSRWYEFQGPVVEGSINGWEMKMEKNLQARWGRLGMAPLKVFAEELVSPHMVSSGR